MTLSRAAADSRATTGSRATAGARSAVDARAVAGAPRRHRPRGYACAGAATAAILALTGCGDSPTEPEDPTPVLSDFSYTIEELNLESCPPAGLEGSSLFRWTVDYDDADGDVQAPIIMTWKSEFQPSGFTKSAVLAVPAAAVVEGDSFAGTIAQTQCIRFVNEASMDITLSILDAAGHQSEFATVTIVRPTGALGPPPESPEEQEGARADTPTVRATLPAP